MVAMTSPDYRMRDDTLDRMVRAVEKVRERVRRAAGALAAAGIQYAVAGGNAVAAWVSEVDEAAVRNTADVDILIRRQDLDAVIVALEQAGFEHRHAAGIDFFLDGPNAKFRDGVHLLFAGEKVRPEYAAPTADVSESQPGKHFQVVALDALVRMKLVSFRDKDRTHLRDMIELGLIDASWPARFVPELAARLQELIDNPE